MNISILETGFVVCKTQAHIDALAELAKKAGYTRPPVNMGNICQVKHRVCFTLCPDDKIWFVTYQYSTEMFGDSEYQYSDFVSE